MLDETRIVTQFLWFHTLHKAVHYQNGFSSPPPPFKCHANLALGGGVIRTVELSFSI